MYKIIISFLVIHLVCSQLKGQNSAVTKTRYIRTTVITNQASNIRGYLFSVDDSSMFITQKITSFKGIDMYQPGAQKVDYSNIANVRVKRKGAVSRGAVYGALVGALAGGTVGLLSGDDPPCQNTNYFNFCFRFTAGEKAVAAAVTGAALGSLTGIIVGALLHKTFIIGGSQEAFNNMKIELVH